MKDEGKVRTCRYCGYPIRAWETIARDSENRTYHPTCLTLMVERKERYERAQKK